jgi:CAAX prenyl protease-like protein
VFLGLLALHSLIAIPDLADQVMRLTIMTIVLLWIARPVLDFRTRRAGASVLIGIVVFALWIGPDLVFPGYRHHVIFENAVMGSARSTLSETSLSHPGVLALRTARAVLVVPIVEELFWRAWLMRWLIVPDFRQLPLGTYTPRSFWLVALLFAAEHGSYWDVGLAAGVIYNWWMMRTKSLGDMILTHAVTNACLSAYVIGTGKWEYWL